MIFAVEERKFYGHKIILGAGSPIMRQMFLEARDTACKDRDIRYSKGKSEEGVTQITLQDFKSAVFEQVLRYVKLMFFKPQMPVLSLFVDSVSYISSYALDSFTRERSTKRSAQKSS